MGGFIPTAAMTVLQLAQSQAKNKAQQTYATAQAQSQTQQIQRRQQLEERQRQDRLRRAMATQRAIFGARGISSGGGSSKAVLKGLEKRAKSNSQDSRDINNMRIKDINSRLAYGRQLNLIDASAARRGTAFDLFKKGLGTFSLLEF